MKFSKYILSIATVFATNLGFSQSDFSLYNFKDIQQVGYTNPAFIPKFKVNVGIPALSSNYLYAGNSGFAYRDFIRKRSDDSLVLNMQNGIDKMAKRNYLTTAFQNELLAFGFKLNKNYFSFNVNEKINNTFTYPKGMFQLAWQGNGDFLGERIDMDGLGIDFIHYREFGIGWARQFSPKLTVGARAKYLTGFSNITTQKSKLGLTTDEVTFDLTADGSLDIRTSGINQFSDTLNTVSFADYILNTKNSGIGLDLGATYAINNKIDVHFSMLDFGFIKWKSDVKSYVQDDFSVKFEGLDANAFFGNYDPNSSTQTATQNGIDQLVDSLTSTFNLKENNDAYTQFLHTRFMLGGNYKLNERNFFGAVFQGQVYKGSFRPAASFSYHTGIKKYLGATVNYSIYNRSYFNFGGGLSLNLSKIQIYAVADNVFAPLFPTRVKNLQARFGINLIFGKVDGDDINKSSFE
jgi:hypothetical protein